MCLSKFSFRRAVTACMLIFGLIDIATLLSGCVSRNPNPGVDTPAVNIALQFDNAAPELIETEVVDPIENQLMGLDGLQRITSTSSEGRANITLEFDSRQNPNEARLEVENRITATSSLLPAQLHPPVITPTGPDDPPIQWVILTADEGIPLEQQMIYARNLLRDQLILLTGVGNVIYGGYVEPSLGVSIDINRLYHYDLTSADVLSSIVQEQIEQPAGRVESPLKEFNIRVLGDTHSPEKFAKIRLNSRGGAPNYEPISLSSIAHIEEGPFDTRAIARYNGKTAVGLGIVKQRGANASEVSRRVQEKVAQIRSSLPPGTHVDVRLDPTQLILNLRAPVGSSIAVTKKAFETAEAWLKNQPDVKEYFTAIGNFNGNDLVNAGKIYVSLAPSAAPSAQRQVMDRARADLKKALPGIELFVQDLSPTGSGTAFGFPVEFTIVGPDWNRLNESAQTLMMRLDQAALVTDLHSNFQPGMPEVHVIPDRNRSADHGVSISSISQEVGTLIGGQRFNANTSFPIQGHRYPIQVRSQPDQHSRPEDINRVRLRNNRGSQGELVPLPEIAEVQVTSAMQLISHFNRQRAITIRANLADGKSRQAAFDALKKMAIEVLPPGYQIQITENPIERKPSGTDFSDLSVSFTLPGATPEIMESQVIEPIEKSVIQVKGIQNLRSTVQTGSGVLSIEFESGYNLHDAILEVRSRISQIRSLLPSNLPPPLVRKESLKEKPIFWLTLTSKDPITLPAQRLELMNYVRNTLYHQLAFTQGVGGIVLQGYAEPSLRVWIDQEKLNRKDITMDDILLALQTENIEIPIGRITNPDREFNVRFLGEASSPAELGKIEIGNRSNLGINFKPIRLDQVASIEEGAAGTQTVDFGIIKQTGAVSADVFDSVKKKMAEITPFVPLPYRLEIRANDKPSTTGSNPIEFAVQGPDWGKLVGYASKFISELRAAGVATEITTDALPEKTDVRIAANPAKAAAHSVSLSQVAGAIDTWAGGATLKRHLPIEIRLFVSQHTQSPLLSQVLVRNGRGERIALSELVDLVPVTSPQMISRLNGTRAIVILIKPASNHSQKETVQAIRRIGDSVLPSDYLIQLPR